jgi:4-hydroxythreonine-4-phosphate dehydrogenase
LAARPDGGRRAQPHAGEGGLFGREEIDIIGPAVPSRAPRDHDRRPVSPRTVFMRARQSGHPPQFDVWWRCTTTRVDTVKYLGIDKGVNVTLGLPLVRTSRTMAPRSTSPGRGGPMPAAWSKPSAWRAAWQTARR